MLNTRAVTDVQWVTTFVICVGAAASFFFALAESALFSLGRWRAQQLAEEQKEEGAKILRLLEEPQELLSTIVLGSTFANAGMLAAALWGGLSGDWPLWLAIVGVLLLVLVVGEVVPKTLAVRSPERWALRLVTPMLVLKRLSLPLRRVAERVNGAVLHTFVPKSWKPQTTLTDEEYQELLEAAYQQGGLGRGQRDLILQIIRLDRRTAKEVMKPRATMACVSDDLAVEEMVAAARTYKHRRLPIYDETPDTIVGILNTRALLLNPENDLSEAVEFPSFVPGSMNLLQLFRSFQRQRRGLGIVLDEFGGTAGLVTTEDILEEVVGEFHGEAERQSLKLEKLPDGRWRAHGAVRLEDFRRECPELGEVQGVDTLGGLVVRELGVVPAAGESVVFRGLRFTAATVDDRRVREVSVEPVKKRGSS